MQVEGIPDGWEFVRVGRVNRGEFFVDQFGNQQQWVDDIKSAHSNYVIIRKIEKPKQFRPFANAAEFEPHRDKWLKLKSHGDHRIKTHSYNDHKHYTGDVGDTWQTMFDDYEFEDGTPFGVEVTE